MSIHKIKHDNILSIEANNLNINRISDITINNLIPTIPTPTTDFLAIDSVTNQMSKVSGNIVNSFASSFRLEVDTSINPDPLTNGLSVPPFSYGLQNQFNLPFTTVSFPGLGLCTAYVDNVIFPPTGLPDYDLTDIDNVPSAGPPPTGGIIRFNNDGKFRFSFNIYLLGSQDPPEGKTVQVLLNGDSIFSSPVAMASSKQVGDNYNTPPFPSPPYSKVWSFTGTCNVLINAGDEVVVQVILNNTLDDNVFSLCSNFSCERLDAQYYGLQGPQGAQGLPGLIDDVDNPTPPTPGEFGLVINPGAPSSTRYIKSLLAGSGITINQIADSLEIVSTGGDNIYNSNGTILNPIRTVSLNGNQLRFQGPGVTDAFDVESANITLEANLDLSLLGVNNARLRAGPSGNITIGDNTLDANVNIFGGTNNNVFINQIPNNTNTNVLYYDDVTGRVSYDVAPSGSGNTIYNANDFLTGNRTVNLNNYNLLFNSTLANSSLFKTETFDCHFEAGNDMLIEGGNLVNIRNTLNGGQILIGDPSGNNSVDIRGGILAEVYINQIPNIRYSNTLYYDDATGRVSYNSNLNNSIFKYSIDPAVTPLNIPYSGSVNIPTGIPGMGSLILRDAIRDWDNSGGDFNPATGIYTATQTFKARITVALDVTANVTGTYLIFIFRKISGTPINLDKHAILLPNSIFTYYDYIFTASVLIQAGEQYVVQLSNVAGGSPGSVNINNYKFTMDRI